MRLKITFLVLSCLLTLAACHEPSEMDAVLNQAKSEGKVVMLEFGSVGCIPCEQMKPVMEKLRTDYKGKLEVISVDARMDRDTSWRFGVVVIPTQIFLDRDGKEFHRHNGFYSYEEIEPILKKVWLYKISH